LERRDLQDQLLEIMKLIATAPQPRCGSVFFASAIVALLVLAPPRDAAAYDGEAGRKKAELCAGCHGADGVSENPAVPSLAGQQFRYMTIALYQFSSGRRQSDQMAPAVADLTNEDFGDIAAYFAALPPFKPTHKSDPGKAEAARTLAQNNHCLSCHTPSLAGQQHVPRIAGQHFDYVRDQLRGFRGATRADIDGNMTSAVQTLSEADLEVLADFVAGFGPP
jgi:cytochrome c553